MNPKTIGITVGAVVILGLIAYYVSTSTHAGRKAHHGMGGDMMMMTPTPAVMDMSSS